MVKARDGNNDEDYYRNRTYWSVDGKVTGWMSGDQFHQQFTYAWDSIEIMALEALAKVKRFDPIMRKDPLLILAEIADGQHEDL